MPQMGESIFEGTITKWLKKPGDTVQQDEPLFEISTDKVDAEIPSPAAGMLSEIKVEAGNTVQINTVVAVIGGGWGSRLLPLPRTERRARACGSRAANHRADGETGSQRSPASGFAPRRWCARLRRNTISTCARFRVPARRAHHQGRLLLHGQGRAAQRQPAAAAPAPRGPRRLPRRSPRRQPRRWSQPGELVPLTRMRSIIAQRMVDSKRTSAHVHTVFKIDLTRIVRIREKEKAKYEQRNGVKLTYMPFITRAVVATLRKMPIVNASMEGDAIRYHKNVNVGIAVALDWGLIVPVIKQAEDKSFLGIARAIADLAERARAKKLKPDEVGFWHLHDYESGHLRRAVRHADHQPAGVGDPGRRRTL